MRIEAKTAFAALLATTIAGSAFAQSSNANENATDNAGASVETPDTSAGADVSAGADISAGAESDSGMSADTGSDMSGDASGDMSGDASGDIDAEASGDMSASSDAAMNYGDIISGLRSNSESGDPATDFEGLSDSAQVETVMLTELRGNAAGNAQALDEALEAQATGMADLRTAIEGNETVTTALQDAGYTAEDVVAYRVDAEGNVTLVVDDTTDAMTDGDES